MSVSRSLSIVLALAPVCLGAASPTATLRYVIETVAGTLEVGDGGPATAAQLSLPQGIAADRKGNLYVADTLNHRVRKISPVGVISTLAGDGVAGARGDGGPSEFARLNLPYAVAVDAEGIVYIADLGNHRVRRVGADGMISTYAGTGEKGSNGDGGRAQDAQLMSPRNLALDANGSLYISEFEGHRVRKVSRAGIISTIAGTGVAGLAGDGGPATKAQFAFPAGLAVDLSNYLYIADSQNHRIRRVGPDGVVVTYLGGTDAVAFSTPVGLALDAAGNLYVAERRAAIRKFTPTGRLFQVAGTGSPGYNGDGRAASTSMLLDPADVALDGTGNLYIADGRRVRRVGITGILTTVAGDAYTRAIGDNGPATRAQLNAPRGLAMDLPGNLYIADSGTNRVRRLSAEGIITTVAGTGAQGSSGDGRAAVDAALNAPSGVAVDGGGNLLVADTGSNRIRQIAGDVIRTLAGSGGTGLGGDGMLGMLMPLHGPMAVASAPGGSVLVGDTLSHRVLALNPASVITTAAGNGSGGYSGDGGRAPMAQLREPSAMAVDASGNLFIADALNNRIRKVTPEGQISTVAGGGSDGFDGDGGPATEARLNQPRGVTVDGDGNLYIADTGNHAIRKVSADGVIHTIAGSGVAGYDGDGGSARGAMLNTPWGVLIDGSGNLYVSDSLNNRIRKLTPAPEPDTGTQTGEARVVNAATLADGPVAPGEAVTVYGDGIGPEQGLGGIPGETGLLPSELGETQVLFDGTPAALLYVQAGQINAQVPYTVAGRGITSIEVYYRKELRARTSLQVVEANPGIYTVSGGTGQAAALNEDGSFNSEENAAPRGSKLTLFATGEGLTEPAGVDGLPGREPLPRPVLKVHLSIAGIDAEILSAAAAPGLLGMMQIEAHVPAGFAPTGVLPITLTVGAATSQPGVTVAVR